VQCLGEKALSPRGESLRHSAPRAVKTSFRGNKVSLPSKPCVACGRDMTWRKHWAKNWAEVKFCSAACRSGKA